MKTTMILFIGILITTLVYSKQWKSITEGKKETGIGFHKGTWNDALQLAKKEGKPIFLDISASWCGPCKMLKSRTFPNEEVGEFYNANFINVAVDGEKGEGVQLARKYRIQKPSGFPSPTFFIKRRFFLCRDCPFKPTVLLKIKFSTNETTMNKIYSHKSTIIIFM